MPASGKIAASDTMMPLPIAVPRCSWKRSIAAMMSSLFCVGGCTSAAVPANETTPMRALRGCSLTNALAATCDAVRRFGSTSAARMLPDTSIARMIVSCCDGSVITAVGRATATNSAVSASRNSTGGTCLRQPGPRPSASLTSDRFA